MDQDHSGEEDLGIDCPDPYDRRGVCGIDPIVFRGWDGRPKAIPSPTHGLGGAAALRSLPDRLVADPTLGPRATALGRALLRTGCL
jgi:hypothetical protein